MSVLNTWADGHGLWHAVVSAKSEASAEVQGRRAIRAEVQTRQAGPVHLPRLSVETVDGMRHWHVWEAQ